MCITENDVCSIGKFESFLSCIFKDVVGIFSKFPKKILRLAFYMNLNSTRDKKKVAFKTKVHVKGD